jgi:hypothetical protein
MEFRVPNFHSHSNHAKPFQELENLEFLQAKGSEFAERKLNEVAEDDMLGWHALFWIICVATCCDLTAMMVTRGMFRLWVWIYGGNIIIIWWI